MVQKSAALFVMNASRRADDRSRPQPVRTSALAQISAAGQHQDHQSPRQVFAHQDRGDNGNARQQVRPEFPAQQLGYQLNHERPAAQQQRRQQRQLVNRQPEQLATDG